MYFHKTQNKQIGNSALPYCNKKYELFLCNKKELTVKDLGQKNPLPKEQSVKDQGC